MNHESFLTRRPSSTKDRLLKWNQFACQKIVVVDFDIIWESVDNIEAAWIPYDYKHKFSL
jgi:hypothetical protein